jgi:hypothetical protein
MAKPQKIRGILGRIRAIGDCLQRAWTGGCRVDRSPQRRILRVEELEARVALDGAGNTIQTARSVGTLGSGQIRTYRDAVSPADKLDFYKVKVASALSFETELSGLKGNADLQLLAANRRVLAASSHNGKTNEVVQQVLAPGTYYLRVSAVGRANTPYTLALSATLIPQQGVYEVAVRGTTYSGNTNFLLPSTSFAPYQTFALNGLLIVTSTVDTANASNNGLNGRDVALNTGNIGLGGAGVMQYATNTLLHRLFGGSSGQNAAVDMAYVSTNARAGTIEVQVDTRRARISQLNTLFRGGGLLALPFQITAGTMHLRFTDGGRRLSGTLTFYGEGYIEAGTAAVQATFEGRLR